MDAFNATVNAILGWFFAAFSWAGANGALLSLTVLSVLVKRLHHGAGLVIPMVLVGSVLFAFVTERFIEEPVEKIRRRIAKG